MPLECKKKSTMPEFFDQLKFSPPGTILVDCLGDINVILAVYARKHESIPHIFVEGLFLDHTREWKTHDVMFLTERSKR